jgi:hypothetical protein
MNVYWALNYVLMVCGWSHFTFTVTHG